MTASTLIAPPLPRTTEAMLRKASTGRRAVVVRYLDTEIVAALPDGLTDMLSNDPDVDVLLTTEQLDYWLGRAGGDHATAARIINAWLREMHRLEMAAEARLMAVAA